MPRHLFLGGIKHSGKTSTARHLSALMQCPWVDLDHLVEQALSPYPSIRAFYQSEGQEAFQNLEYQSLLAFLTTADEPHIIALGGGACDNEPLMALVGKSGRLIYLQVDQQILYERIEAGGLPPFLDPADPRASFDALYRSRHESYSKSADLLIQLPVGLSAEQTALYVYNHMKEER